MSSSGESIIITFLRDQRDRARNASTILLVMSVLGLSIFGIVMLYSTSSALFGEEKLIKQSQWIVIGMAAAAVLYFLDYRWLCRNRIWILLLIIPPLAYLAAVNVMDMAGVDRVMPFTRKINGAYRWLVFGPIRVQPGELAKLAIIVFLAGHYGAKPRRAKQFWRGVAIPALVLGLVVALLLLGGSLSLTMITCAVICVMMFVAGIPMRYFIVMGMAGILLVSSVLVVSPARLQRVTGSWLRPEEHRQGAGYQLTHSQYAIGSGHWQGVGLNNSRMKEGYLPFSWTDFILSIVAEELGFAGMLSVMVAFLLLVGSGFLISALATDRQGLLLGVGIGFSIGFHAFTNIAVVTGALPTTGVTVPLISYGGSSMLLTWLGIGLLGSIARVSKKGDVEENSTLARDLTNCPVPLTGDLA